MEDNIVYLHFENWSRYLEFVKPGLPRGEAIVKVFATFINPCLAFDIPTVAVIEIDGSPIDLTTRYSFSDGRYFTGEHIESYLTEKNLTAYSKQLARGLFRFSHSQGFLASAMTFRFGGEPIIAHPMDEIDGWKWKNRYQLHLDIFFPQSLQVLKEVVDYKQESLLVPAKLGTIWRQRAEVD